MKRLSIAFAAVLFILACNNEAKTDDKPAEKKEPAVAISYPYTAGYSSDMSIGDANHSKLVLDLYKLWEDNKISDMKPLLADSVTIYFPDGNKFDNTADSMINFARQYRSGITSVKTNIDAWVPVHLNDKNEDYVLIWSRDYNTDKTGKIDSSRSHAYFQVKNNKLRAWSEFRQELAPAKK